VSGSADRGSRRLLVTGADTFWGGRVAQAFEADPDVEVVVGIGARDPSVPLERTDFVRVSDHSYSTVQRIVSATGVDTIVHTGVMVDSTLGSSRLHDVNVIGSLNLLAAAGAPGSTVRALVVKSSGLVYGATSRNLSRRWSPSLFGYDPLLQFIEQGDVVRALIHAVRSATPGTFNVGAPGRVPLSEVAEICGTRLVPLPPWKAELVSAPFTRVGAFDLPPELVMLLRYGRGMDTKRFAETGFDYRFSSVEAIHAFARAIRLRKGAGRPAESYTYQEDLEHFLRHANSVAHRADEPSTPA